MSGVLGDLSEEQAWKLSCLKQRINNELQDPGLRDYATKFCIDIVLLKFLRARKFDVNAAYEMLVSTLIFRTSFQGRGVDAITVQSVPNEIRQEKTFFRGYDRDNRPVCIMKVRNHDPSKTDFLESQRFTIWLMEYGRTLVRPPVETVTIIFDMTGAGMRNVDMKSVQFLVQSLQNHYPESLGKVLIYNSPWFMHGVWKVVKPWLDAITAAKVYFVDKRGIRDYISDENLLVEYGGRDNFTYDAEYFFANTAQYLGPTTTTAGPQQ